MKASLCKLAKPCNQPEYKYIVTAMGNLYMNAAATADKRQQQLQNYK